MYVLYIIRLSKSCIMNVYITIRRHCILFQVTFNDVNCSVYGDKCSVADEFVFEMKMLYFQQDKLKIFITLTNYM